VHSNLNRALDKVLKHEGGYVNHPNDPGGPTNLGVTLANFKRYVNPKGTIDDLKKLTVAQAKTVFERQYWDAVRGNQLPSGLDYAVFDFAVNSGPSRAAKFLQAIVGVVQDGVIGPETLKAIEAQGNMVRLVQHLCDKRLAWLRGRKTWPSFGKGWESRVMDVRLAGSLWASEPAAAPLPPVQELPPAVPTETLPPAEPASASGFTWTGFAIGALIAAFAVWYFFLR
jgi:lysozyme family protein